MKSFLFFLIVRKALILVLKRDSSSNVSIPSSSADGHIMKSNNCKLTFQRWPFFTWKGLAKSRKKVFLPKGIKPMWQGLTTFFSDHLYLPKEKLWQHMADPLFYYVLCYQLPDHRLPHPPYLVTDLCMSWLERNKSWLGIWKIEVNLLRTGQAF